MATAFDPYWQWLAIPTGGQPVDHYRLLGAERFEANSALLHERAMQRMAEVRKYQMGPHAEHALRLQQEISRAFDTLNDPARKAEYDRQLRSASALLESTVALEPSKQMPQVLAPPPRVVQADTATSPPQASLVQTVRDDAARRASRQSRERPEMLVRLAPWFTGAVVLLVIAVIVLLFGGNGTLQVLVSGGRGPVVASLDNEIVDIQELTKGRTVSRGMHTLQIEGLHIDTYRQEFAVHRGQDLLLQVALVSRQATASSPAASTMIPTGSTQPKPPASAVSPDAVSPKPPSSTPPTPIVLAGTVWHGDDVYPNTTFTFESGGVLAWSHERGSYRLGSWRQIDNTVYFQQNDKFREFRGLIQGERIEGDAWNVDGKRWRVVLNRMPDVATVPSLAGTVWSGFDVGMQRTYRFESGGVLSYNSAGVNYRNGRWTQTGSRLYFEMNGKYREFQGTISGNSIEGDSWNTQGMKWKTSLRKQ